MMNRVDFYQGQCKDLAIPAGRCEVFVEGVAYPFLEVSEVVRANRPTFGHAKLRYNTAALDQSRSFSIEQTERMAAVGKKVEICRLVNTGEGEVKIEPVRIFVGLVEETGNRLGPKEQVLEITAKDFAARLDRVTVSGRRIATTAGQSSFNNNLEVVFNEDGQPNASKQQIHNNGKSYTVFAGDGQDAKYWSCAEVLEYLLSEYVVYGQLQVPPMEYLGVLTGGKVADELDIEGKSVLEALQECCDQVGLQFVFKARQGELGPAESIVFYWPGEGRRVELNLQYTGERLSISKTNVYTLHGRNNNEPADLDRAERIEIQTPVLLTNYEVGDRITSSPDSRDILGARCDNRSIFYIERLRMDFEKQCTNLRIFRKRMYA